MLAGIMAGFGLWGSMFPIDTIKSKMQVCALGAVVGTGPREGSSSKAFSQPWRPATLLCA